MDIKNNHIFRILVGDNASIKLEGIIFISASLLCISMGFIAILWNCFIGLPLLLNILIVVLVFFFALIYYYARLKQIYNGKVLVLVTLLFLSCIWFFNNGIRGSVPGVYLLALPFFLCITSTKDHLKVLLVTVVNFVLLVYIERIFGDNLMIYHQSEKNVLIDNIFGFVVCICFSYLLLTAIIKSYYKERDKLVHKELEMKKLNDSKDLLFNIIAHDLRSPFTSLLGLTEIMADNSNNLSIKQYQKYAELNLRTMNKAFGLLETLLNWGRIQQGTIQVNPQKINLKKVVEESVEWFEEKYSRKKIETSIDVKETIEPYTDRYSIQTVIRNLISNAIKYTPQGGKISIYAEELEDNKVIIDVKDTGIGMNKEIIDNLFQLDIKSNRPGLDGEISVGLGLVICKGLVESQGGYLKLKVKLIEVQLSNLRFKIPRTRKIFNLLFCKLYNNFCFPNMYLLK